MMVCVYCENRKGHRRRLWGGDGKELWHQWVVEGLMLLGGKEIGEIYNACGG